MITADKSQLFAWIPTETHKRVKRRCADMGIKMGDYVATALDKLLDDTENADVTDKTIADKKKIKKIIAD